MRCLLVALTLFIFTQSAPLQSDQDAKILQYEFNTDGKGNYNYSFSTSNGITKSETGTVVDEGLPTQYILVEGKIFYITPDGNEETWMYQADKDGFRLLAPQIVQCRKRAGQASDALLTPTTHYKTDNENKIS